jgi:hypothetical protein
MVTHDSEKSRGIRSDFVTIMTVGEGEPAKNQGSEGADAPEIGYLLIPSCESRARPELPPDFRRIFFTHQRVKCDPGCIL